MLTRSMETDVSLTHADDNRWVKKEALCDAEDDYDAPAGNAHQKYIFAEER